MTTPTEKPVRRGRRWVRITGAVIVALLLGGAGAWLGRFELMRWHAGPGRPTWVEWPEVTDGAEEMADSRASDAHPESAAGL